MLIPPRPPDCIIVTGPDSDPIRLDLSHRVAEWRRAVAARTLLALVSLGAALWALAVTL
jgi:hypothetical protein